MKTWCFQIGTVSLSRSISAREASKAWPRCADAVATMTAASPMASVPVRWTAATAWTSYDEAISARHLLQPVERRGVRGVVESGDALAPVVVTDVADEQVDTAGRVAADRVEHLLTSSGVSRMSTRRTTGKVGHGPDA